MKYNLYSKVIIQQNYCGTTNTSYEIILPRVYYIIFTLRLVENEKSKCIRRTLFD